MKHKYADILHAIADGEVIEWQFQEGNWVLPEPIDVLYDIADEAYAPTRYRIKPRTININGHEVPEPMRVAPANRSAYYVPAIGPEMTVSTLKWDNDSADSRYLQRGPVHATREAAEAHAKALLSFTEVKYDE